MSQQQPPPQGPYSQDPYASQPGFSQPAYQAYPQAYPPAPRKPLDYGKLLTIGAWVVLGLHAVAFFFLLTVDGPVFYSIVSDDGTNDFADRFFGGMPMLGQGVFFTGVLLALGQWLEKQKHAV